MRDDHDYRILSENRHHLANSIQHLLGRIMQAFRVLHVIHWSAPWAPSNRQDTCGC